MGFSLNDKQRVQRQLISSPSTHLLTYGGSRGGKTFGFTRAIILRALLADGSRHLISRFRFNAAKRTIRLDTFPKVMSLCFPGVPWKPKDPDGYIILPNGSEVWYGGLETPERIDKVLGAEYSTIFLNEASEIPYEVVTTLRTRLAQNVLITNGTKKGETLRLKMFYDLNPTTRNHWTYQEFIEGMDPTDKVPLEDPDDYKYMVINPKDNPHLSPAYIKSLDRLPRLQKKRFAKGEYLTEVDGSLWNSNSFARTYNAPQLDRIVIAIDPSGAADAKQTSADEIGIVPAGRSKDKFYVLDDFSMRASPTDWAKIAVTLYRRLKADCIVFESNYGGPMGEALIKSIDRNVKVRSVVATRGKHVRAEPVAAVYDEGRVYHVGTSPRYEKLEDQLMSFTAKGYMGAGSPDRADALVWAITDLMDKGEKVVGGTYEPRG